MSDIKLKENITVGELVQILQTLRQDVPIMLSQRLRDNKHGFGEYPIKFIDLMFDHSHDEEFPSYVLVSDKSLLKPGAKIIHEEIKNES